MNVSLYPAEFVFPGHPDKLCDAIADALVQAAYTLEKRALVGVEVACHRNKVFITGRIGCRDANTIDVDALVRNVYRSAGYGPDWYRVLQIARGAAHAGLSWALLYRELLLAPQQIQGRYFQPHARPRHRHWH